MISDIELIGLDDNINDMLYDKLTNNELLSLACNYQKVKENIEYLKSYGINNITDLLINRTDIFLKSKEELAKAFTKVNIPVFVNILNNDYNIIDEIF